MTNQELFLRLALQFAVILATCHLVGLLGRRIGQAQVVGEMIAGVLLGPSLLGWLLPDVKNWLFPLSATIHVAGVTTTIHHPSMAILYAISQIGLTIYMFIIGLELDTHLLRQQSRSAGLVSAAGILVPFILGASATFLIFNQPGLFGKGVNVWMAALFFGAALCITAFPMLARILQEHKIAGTRLGTVVLAAASIDDAAVWCLLAVVLASFKDSAQIALFAIGGGIIYVAFMLTIGGRAVSNLVRYVERNNQQSANEGSLSIRTLAIILFVLMLCAWFTTYIGIYQVFGAFIAGVAMQQTGLAPKIRQKLEALTVAFLLPVFFVYSGLNTQIGLVNTPTLWGITLAIIVIASLGKGGATLFAARVSGESWQQSAKVGVLMNARGLIELIMLNIGLEQGIITPTLFTIMVLMAIITTLMASPLFRWLHKRSSEDNTNVQPEEVSVPVNAV